MGTYHEPRVPAGQPVTGEKDVWLDSGEIKFGHWDGSTWVIDRTIGAVEDSETIDYGTDLLAAEDWSLVGDTGKAQFGTGWSNSAPLNPMKYRLLTNGAVEVRGEAVTTGAGLIIMEMPSGYRPSEDLTSDTGPASQFYTSGEWVNGWVDVDHTDGFFEWGNSIPEGTQVRFSGFCYAL